MPTTAASPGSPAESPGKPTVSIIDRTVIVFFGDKVITKIWRTGPGQAVVQAVADTIDVDARREGVGEVADVVDAQRGGQAVDREQQVVVGVGLDLDRRLHVDDPAGGRSVAHLEFVGRDVDAGELEVGFRK